MTITQLTDFLGLTNSKSQVELPPEQELNITRDLGPKEVFLKWESTVSSTNSKFDSKYNRTFLIIGIVVALLLVLMQEFFLILVIVSLFFIRHALSVMAPQKVSYEISNHGVIVNGAYYSWSEFKRFFFSSYYGEEILAMDLRSGVPSRLIIHSKASDKEKITEFLGRYIAHLEEEPVTFMDKAYTSFIDKFDFERKKR